MASFCKQCGERILGFDTQELKGMSSPADTRKGLYPIVVCEGCGVIQVDHLGNCVSKDCLEEGHKKKRPFIIHPLPPSCDRQSSLLPAPPSTLHTLQRNLSLFRPWLQEILHRPAIVRPPE